ncbi:hypothetical protein [Priestia aryabhattai]
MTTNKKARNWVIGIIAAVIIVPTLLFSLWVNFESTSTVENTNVTE